MASQRTPIVCDLSPIRRGALLRRIFARAVVPDFFGCWEWRGQHAKDGYSQMLVMATDGKWKQAKVHRVCWALVFGQPPAGKQLHHSCENEGCISPLHVAPLTPAEHGVEHRADACAKGHLLEGGNLRAAVDGKRGCRICANERIRISNRAASSFHRGEHKTECKHGHPWVPDNVRVKPNGHTECRACHRARERARQARLRAQRQPE